MIKIRYLELPAGLHVRAEANGRSTIIYLLPGLTHGERRAALLRARRSGSLGHGPRLPGGSVAAAVVRDRIGGTARNGAAAFRAHPLLLLPPVLIAVSATLVYVMVSAVAITFPQATPGGAVSSAAPGTSGPARAARPGRPARPGGAPGARDPGAAGNSKSPAASASPRPSGSRSPSPAPGSGSPGPIPSGSAPPGPAPSSSPVPPAPTPSPGPSHCLNIGSLGLCLK